MERRSLRNLLRRKRAERRHMSLEMRNLMESFEAQYERPKPPVKNSPDTADPARASQEPR
jgi:hypothetical protein